LDVYLDDKEIHKLYTTGKSIKLSLPEQVVEKFFASVQKMQAAENIYDFWKDPALNFKKLQGHENRYSMRLSSKYRLEIEIEWLDKEKTKGNFRLKKISAHYGD